MGLSKPKSAVLRHNANRDIIQGLADPGPFGLKISGYVSHGVLFYICRREGDPFTTADVMTPNVPAGRSQSTQKVKLLL